MKTEKAINLIDEEIRKERAGVPVLISKLRGKVKISKIEFDAAIIDMIRSKRYFPSVYAHPLAILTDTEKDAMVPNGEGSYFFSINPREGVDIPKVQPGQFPNKDHSLDSIFSNMKPGRGGSRDGAGRPAVKTKSKRVQLAGARIPGWLMEWLKSEGDIGRKVEMALIEKYKLTPPG